MRVTQPGLLSLWLTFQTTQLCIFKASMKNFRGEKSVSLLLIYAWEREMGKSQVEAWKQNRGKEMWKKMKQKKRVRWKRADKGGQRDSRKKKMQVQNKKGSRDICSFFLSFWHVWYKLSTWFVSTHPAPLGRQIYVCVCVHEPDWIIHWANIKPT